MNYRLRIITSRNEKVIRKRLSESGADSAGVEIILRKTRPYIIRIEGLNAPQANILKQQLLSLGSDVSIHRDAITGNLHGKPVIVVSDIRRLETLIEKFKEQPFGLLHLAEDIIKAIKRLESPPTRIPLPDGTLDLSKGPVVMGILNVTPDSFSDGGLYLDRKQAVERGLKMAEEGAGIIDVGGESTRPGAKEVDEDEEKRRVIPVIEDLSKRIDIPISIDTRKSSVAKSAIEAGARIINDVSALKHDPQMINLSLKYNVPVVVMHMKGIPENMQDNPYYEDATTEILNWLENRTNELIAYGIEREKIIIDPGIGFGKRLEDNLDIISEFGDFLNLGFALMVGYSRKSFIGLLTGKEPRERVAGGLAVLGKLLDSGAQIIRVHDVAETVDYIKVWKALESGGDGKR